MNWKDEFKLYWNDNLPANGEELEGLLEDLHIAQSDLWVTKFGKTGLDAYKAQQRVRETLRRRWRIKIAIILVVIGVLIRASRS